MIYRLTFEIETDILTDVKARAKLKIIGYPSYTEKAKLIKYVEIIGSEAEE